MFVAKLMFRRNPMTGMVSSLAALATIGTALCLFRKKIPHITECSCIGCCYIRGGCHKHEKINLLIEVHKAANVPKGQSIYFYSECGRFDSKSTDVPANDDQEVAIYERINLHVRQVDNIITISLWRKGVVSSVLLGEETLNVITDIIDKDFPKYEWYTLKKNNKNTVKVQLSFFQLAASLQVQSSALLEYAIVHSKLDNEIILDDKTFESLNDKQKLMFLSSALEGPLQCLLNGKWVDFYFKIIEDKDNMLWYYWKSEEDCTLEKNPAGAIPLLAVSHVLADTHDSSQFFIRYLKKNGSNDVFFKRVDRSRDIWSEGLYEFIGRLRDYLLKKTDLTGNEDASNTDANQSCVSSEFQISGDHLVLLYTKNHLCSNVIYKASLQPTYSEDHSRKDFLRMVLDQVKDYEYDQFEDKLSLNSNFNDGDKI